MAHNLEFEFILILRIYEIIKELVSVYCIMIYKPRHENSCLRGFRTEPTQPQQIARGLIFQIYEVDGLYYAAKMKVLICVFVFAYAKSRFSHDAAHI